MSARTDALSVVIPRQSLSQQEMSKNKYFITAAMYSKWGYFIRLKDFQPSFNFYDQILGKIQILNLAALVQKIIFLLLSSCHFLSPLLCLCANKHLWPEVTHRMGS